MAEKVVKCLKMGGGDIRIYKILRNSRKFERMKRKVVKLEKMSGKPVQSVKMARTVTRIRKYRKNC